jgi:hypothetical protein
MAMWVRSHWIDEQWKFAPQPCGVTARLKYEMSTHSWLACSKGMLMWRSIDVPESKSVGVISAGWGYQQTVTPGPALPANISTAPGGERKLNLPGFELHVMPPQIITFNTPASILAPANGFRGPGLLLSAYKSTVVLGFRILTIRWWLLVGLTAIAPAIWGWGAAVWWKRFRIGKTMAAIICRNCGYDMRATPQRCPECGCEPETKTVKPQPA